MTHARVAAEQLKDRVARPRAQHRPGRAATRSRATPRHPLPNLDVAHIPSIFNLHFSIFNLQ